VFLNVVIFTCLTPVKREIDIYVPGRCDYNLETSKETRNLQEMRNSDDIDVHVYCVNNFSIAGETYGQKMNSGT
jgi:hypothetical protein